MSKMHWIKKIPPIVLGYFVKNFPPYEGYTYKFYWYTGSKGQKVYGCQVYKEGEFYHNATQASEKEFWEMTFPKKVAVV